MSVGGGWGGDLVGKMNKSHHIETIKGFEKLGPQYQPPSIPANAEVLASDLRRAQNQAPSLGVAVWKVKRESAHHPRRLTLPNGRYLKCRVIGGVTHWWFVRVSTADGLRQLEAQRR